MSHHILGGLIARLKKRPRLLRAATNRGLTQRSRLARAQARRKGGDLHLSAGAIRFRMGGRDILFPPDDLHFALYFIEHIETFLPRLIFAPAGLRWVADCRGAAHYRLPSGGRVELPAIAEPIDFFSGYFLRGGPRPGDVVWDAGAFCGETAIEMASRVGPTGHVLAFEPDAGNVRWLERNVAASGLRNITVVPKGLWARTTVLEFSGTHDPSASLVDGSESTRTGVAPTQIAVLSPADAWSLLGRAPDFIKMDIEGAEVEVIEALAPLLHRSVIRLAVASYHLRGDVKTSALITPLLENCGLRVETGYPHHQTTWAWRE
ncbi:MAG: FkbM family methyltransferase [Undibacterium sp.]|nr:FkbM family methyltransferase [Opitutaceae bacterium]